MYDPCSFCPKGEYSQPCCSVQCSYGRDLDELKMLREQVKKLAEVVGGELVQGIDADTCAIENPRLSAARARLSFRLSSVRIPLICAL